VVQEALCSPYTDIISSVSTLSLCLSVNIDEFNIWGAFDIHTLVASDSKESREPLLEKCREGKVEILISTIKILQNHIRSIETIQWKIVIFDEFHVFRNPDAEMTIFVRRKLKSALKIGMT
jgi:hypothetical protein